MSEFAHRRPHGAAHWAVMALAGVVASIGATLFAGGVYLIALGGSWYYGLAGLALLFTANYLFGRNIAALWLYLVVWVATLVWAYWEVGFDAWAQVPRLVAPTVLLVAILCASPALGRRRPSHRVLS